MATLTIGTDPEFFLSDRDGVYRSAIPVVKGGKDNKVDLGNGCLMFYDNVLLEMNIRQGKTPEELISILQKAFNAVAKKIYPYVLVPISSHTFNKSECQHPEALRFGCEPEYCAYELMQMNPPICEEGNTFRSAGGHIHLGYNKQEYPLTAPIVDEDSSERDWGRLWVIRMLDLFVGIPSLFLDNDPSSAKRRQLYGKAGTHRPKDYGVEYRTTGNFWLRSPKLTSLIFKLCRYTVDFCAGKEFMEMWPSIDECTAYSVQELRDAINNTDISKAKKFMDTIIKKYMSPDLYTEIYTMSEPIHYDFYREWSISV